MSDRAPFLDPEHTALLVMDLQVSIVESLGNSDGLLERVADAIATVRRHGGQIGYVRVAFEDADYAAIPSTNKTFSSAAALGTHLHVESPTTAIHQDVAPEAGDIIVRKTRVGAFSTTDLDDQLRRRGITTLVLIGISTSGVVLSTLRDAADRDYLVVVLADATADPMPGVHEFLTETIFPRQAHIISTAELEGLFSPSSP